VYILEVVIIVITLAFTTQPFTLAVSSYLRCSQICDADYKCKQAINLRLLRPTMR